MISNRRENCPRESLLWPNRPRLRRCLREPISYWVLFGSALDSFRQRASILNVPLNYSLRVRLATLAPSLLKPLLASWSASCPSSVIYRQRLAEATRSWRLRAEPLTPFPPPLLCSTMESSISGFATPVWWRSEPTKYFRSPPSTKYRVIRSPPLFSGAGLWLLRDEATRESPRCAEVYRILCG